MRLDRWRGLAVWSMIVDHTALLALSLGYGGPWDVLRLTVGRLAFPLFLIVSGHLWARRGARRGRLLEVAGCGLFVSAVCVLAGFPVGQPDILLLIAAGLAAMPLLTRAPLWWLCVGVIQPFTWPVPWSGYQPGAVVVLLLVGWWVSAGEFDFGTRPLRLSAASWCPGWVATVGRHPLGVYVGHVTVLAVLYGGVVWAR